jgi:serine/threonine-protein kinase
MIAMPQKLTDQLFTALQAALRGRYLLVHEVGRGGMGVVYLARDLALERQVAIKLLPPHLAQLPALRGRFLQEARTAAGLSHPHIVPIHAVEDHGEVVCFIMGYVPGQTLAERVRSDGPLPATVVSRIVQEVAWALAYAHQHGVIHRDVKPENILLERGSGRVLVTDFGIARLADQLSVTPPGDVMGTPRMVSPEQVAGEVIDGRSDLYSLGVTAFFALTGRYPFEGENAGQLLAQHLTLPAPPVASLRAGVPPALAVAIDRCLAKDPASRSASGEDLAAALTDVVGSSPIPRVLQQLVREISSLGVDLVSFGTLVAVAVASQMLTRDFLGFGFVYTVGVAAVLVALAAIRGLSLARLIREAAREGWEQADLLSAADREAREEISRTGPPAPLGRHLMWYVAGLAALLLFWLGPKQWGQAEADTALGLIIELLALAGPVALGRWLGARLEAPRDGRPGLLSRFFLKVKSGWFFRLLGRKAGQPRAVPAIANQPTEVLLARQARELLGALPPAERERLGGANDLLRRLEGDAATLRHRLDDLDQAAAALGGSTTPERHAVGESIADARHHAAERLGATVSALETLRLELLRARAGLSPGDGLTENLGALHRLTDRIDGAIEASDA